MQKVIFYIIIYLFGISLQILIIVAVSLEARLRQRAGNPASPDIEHDERDANF
jgi:hypothetical protein